eukprot:jgi/Bigna1/78506/fgenesh1_pg.55_\
MEPNNSRGSSTTTSSSKEGSGEGAMLKPSSSDSLSEMLVHLEKDTKKIAKDFSSTVTQLKDMNAMLEAISVKHMQVLAQASKVTMKVEDQDGGGDCDSTIKVVGPTYFPQETRSTIAHTVANSRKFVEAVCKNVTDLEKISEMEEKLRCTRSSLSALERLVDRRLAAKSGMALTPGASARHKGSISSSLIDEDSQK